jgi:hypothetical protein
LQAVDYFSFKYPHYKFIDEDSVNKICEKYGLVYGKIDRYIGTVPDKNLAHIEKFKIDSIDECYDLIKGRHIKRHCYTGQYISRQTYLQNTCPYDNILNYERHFSRFEGIETINLGDSEYQDDYEKCSLEIVAPVNDFDMKSSEIKDFKLSEIQIPDPVVLKPVHFNSEKYYLIITAWGIEGSDELVVNHKNN